MYDGDLRLYSYVEGNPLSNVDPLGLAYFAYRPLSGLPWLGPFSNNLLDNAMHTSLSHEQLFFEDTKSPSNIGFFGDGSLKSEPSPQGYRRVPGSYDDCVMRIAVRNVKLKAYRLAGNNCQDWADTVRDEHNRLSSDPATIQACHK